MDIKGVFKNKRQDRHSGIAHHQNALGTANAIGDNLSKKTYL